MPISENRKEGIAIIGLGRTGTAIGYLLRQAGYPVVAVASRSQTSLQKRRVYTGGEAFTAEANSEAASLATCIFITTPDDSIATVCREIVQKGGVDPGDKVIHMSGAGGLDLLEPAREAGAKIASIHPLQSFADIEGQSETSLRVPLELPPMRISGNGLPGLSGSWAEFPLRCRKPSNPSTTPPPAWHRIT